MTNPRSRVRRDRFRAAVLAQWGPWCWLCHAAINLDLKFPHRGSYTADHVVEVATLLERGQDPFDPRNGRPAHLSCNSSRGSSFGNKRRAPKPPIRTSRSW